MDNASKAMVIAAAVLMIVCILQIGMSVYTRSKDSVDRTIGQIDTMEVLLFNQNFEQYYEKNMISGTELQNLISAAINANSKAYDRVYSISIGVVLNPKTSNQITWYVLGNKANGALTNQDLMYGGRQDTNMNVIYTTIQNNHMYKVRTKRMSNIGTIEELVYERTNY